MNRPSLAREDQPPWRALGVEQGNGGEWVYIFEAHGREMRIRSSLITSPPTALALDSDADRWRSMFPHPRFRARFDHLKVAGFLVRECWAAQVRKDEAEKAAQQQAER